MDGELHHKWYKQMYTSLHKIPQHGKREPFSDVRRRRAIFFSSSADDTVTVSYKTPKKIPYKSSGYASEPELNFTLDPKCSGSSSSLERRRVAQAKDQYHQQRQQEQSSTTTSVTYPAGRRHLLYDDERCVERWNTATSSIHRINNSCAQVQQAGVATCARFWRPNDGQNRRLRTVHIAIRIQEYAGGSQTATRQQRTSTSEQLLLYRSSVQVGGAHVQSDDGFSCEFCILILFVCDMPLQSTD